jgi:hypothetical protein
MSLLHVGDIGATIVILLNNTAIPGDANIDVIVTDPSGKTTTWVLEAGELNKTTGIITHKSKAGELPYEGEYQVQCRETHYPDIDVRTNTDTFAVYRRLMIEIPVSLEGRFTVESA